MVWVIFSLFVVVLAWALLGITKTGWFSNLFFTDHTIHILYSNIFTD